MDIQGIPLFLKLHRKGIWFMAKKKSFLILSGVILLLVVSLFIYYFNKINKNKRFEANVQKNKITKKSDKIQLPKVEKKLHKLQRKTIQRKSYTEPTSKNKTNLNREEEFIQEVKEEIPDIIEVKIHKPGVIFFRHKPAPPSILEEDMERLAELYRDEFEYNNSVNVVFFISGRPIFSRVFFK